MASAAGALNGAAYAALCVMLVLSSLGQELPKASLCCTNSCASYCNSSCTAAANRTCDIQLPIAEKNCFLGCNSSCPNYCARNDCSCDGSWWSERCGRSCMLSRFDVGCNMYSFDTIYMWCLPSCNTTCYNKCIGA